jgi:hypothetical protein
MAPHPESDPFSGSWVFVPDESHWPGPPPRSWVQDITCSAERIRVVERIESDTGEHTSHVVDAEFDGREYAVAGSAQVETIAYTRPEESRIDGVARKAGRVVFSEVIAVAPERGRLTQTIVFARTSGEPVQGIAVFKRR